MRKKKDPDNILEVVKRSSDPKKKNTGYYKDNLGNFAIERELYEENAICICPECGKVIKFPVTINIKYKGEDLNIIDDINSYNIDTSQTILNVLEKIRCGKCRCQLHYLFKPEFAHLLSILLNKGYINEYLFDINKIKDTYIINLSYDIKISDDDEWELPAAWKYSADKKCFIFKFDDKFAGSEERSKTVLIRNMERWASRLPSLKERK